MARTFVEEAPADLRMYTREETADLLGTHKDTIVMLSEVGCLKPIKIGKRFMYSHEAIKTFQHDFVGMDLTNKECARKAILQVNGNIN